MKHALIAIAFALSAAACSSDPADRSNEAVAAPQPEATPAAPAVDPVAPVTVPPKPAANVLTLEGLGALRIGRPLPAGTGWAERGAQTSETCRIVSSPDFPGVYAIVEDGLVRRITLGSSSAVKLTEGIGVGATEAEVQAAFGGFRETPHEYVAAPGKYLTAPKAENGEPALRFEIGADGRVSDVHVGTMPVLGYTEACA